MTKMYKKKCTNKSRQYNNMLNCFWLVYTIHNCVVTADICTPLHKKLWYLNIIFIIFFFFDNSYDLEQRVSSDANSLEIRIQMNHPLLHNTNIKLQEQFTPQILASDISRLQPMWDKTSYKFWQRLLKGHNTVIKSFLFSHYPWAKYVLQRHLKLA